MKILAIETSCDETAVCIIETTSGDSGVSVRVLGNALFSQADLHAEYGGVYPNLAKREHSRNLTPLLEKALTEAHLLREHTGTPLTTKDYGLRTILEREPELFKQLSEFLQKHERPDIDLIAVTHGPGLAPALWVGVNFAKALSVAWDIPVLPVNHMEGHIIAALATQGKHGDDNLRFTIDNLRLPAVALLISGGHTELVLIKDEHEYERIGGTCDDASGEAFDKSARLLGLPYPGGPEISKLAKQAREQKLDQPFELPRPMLTQDNFDFSFSGLKTAVRILVEKLSHSVTQLSDAQTMQIAREVEDAITDVLVAKTARAIDEYGAHSLVVGGGVSANAYIRAELSHMVAERSECEIFIPEPALSTDNALMIALAAAIRVKNGIPKNLPDPADLQAYGNLPLY